MASPAAVVVIGAGVSGLACAQALVAAGQPAVVLDRARGVGGRCATRRVDGQAVDHGVAFLHGRDPQLLAVLRGVPGTLLEGWPHTIEGRGRPCQPNALSNGSWRLAFAEGVNAFPRGLARGLDVRLNCKVAALVSSSGDFELRLDDGAPLRAATVVVALAPEQTVELLSTLEQPPPEVRSAAAVLQMVSSQPCLTVLARYPSAAVRPLWHVSYPEGSRVLQLAAHDSSKRPGSPALTLVLQAHPAWSAQHLTDSGWPQALLAEAARLYGPWAGQPSAHQAHPWRHARSDSSAELAGPILVRLPGGVRLGLAGERFTPGGGVEAAWTSGRRLAKRILEEK